MKYILKKEYPGSPKLGTILTHEELQFCNWNEYYQEVIEKDYEILSFTDLFSKNIMKKHQNNNFGIVWGEYTEKDQLDKLSQGKKIHSVKRLSDSEIFTIGDKVSNIYDKDITIINKFEFNHDTITINGNYARLSEINKSKQPLFTTEDGVDIYEGDKFYYVKFVQYNNTLGKPFEIVKGNHPTFKYEPQYEKYFSTKEKAEEYILLNKPCLSYGDVQEYLKVKDCNKVLDLVQSKIKQSV